MHAEADPQTNPIHQTTSDSTVSLTSLTQRSPPRHHGSLVDRLGALGEMRHHGVSRLMVCRP